MTTSVDRRRSRGAFTAPRVFAAGISIVVYIGIVANQATVAQLASGRNVSLSESLTSVWQYIREGTAIAVCLYALNLYILRQRASGHRVRIPYLGFIAAVFFACAAIRALVDTSLPSINILYGLQFTYYLGILIGLTTLSWSERVTFIQLMARLLIPMALIEGYIAFTQVRSAAPVLGATLFGSRPWGTYSSSNNLGLAFVSFAMIFAVSTLRTKSLWIIVCAAGCLATGSRTAILSIVVLIGGILFSRVRRRAFFAPILSAGVIALYVVASSEAVSGRNITDEGRLDTWANGLNYVTSPFEALFGVGLGTGTNAGTVAAGSANVSGPAVVDSTAILVVLNSGLIGLALFLIALFVAIKRTDFAYRWTIYPPILICAFSFNFFEISPLNVLAASAIGVAWRPSEADVSPLLLSIDGANGKRKGETSGTSVDRLDGAVLDSKGGA